MTQLEIASWLRWAAQHMDVTITLLFVAFGLTSILWELGEKR
jgi:hypothetical protein